VDCQPKTQPQRFNGGLFEVPRRKDNSLVTQSHRNNKKRGRPRRACREPYGDFLTVPLETPEDWADFDDIRWYLAHERVSVFVWQGDWYLRVHNKCRYLSRTDRVCQIHRKKPSICRTQKRAYDHDATADTSELYFHNDRQTEEWMRVRFPRRAKKKFDKQSK